MRNLRFPYSGKICLSIAAFLSAACPAASIAATPQANTGFPPNMPLKDRTDILNAAGYEITANGQTVFIYCGEAKTPSRPVVGAADLTGDGKPEYVIMAEHNCPGESPIPVKTDIVMRRPDGIWQNILSVNGAPKPAEGATNGWRNLNVTLASGVVTYVHDTQTERYSSVSTVQARKNLALAFTPAKTPANALPTAGWTKPYTMGAVSPGDLAAILTAAGFKRVSGKWTGCNGASEVQLFEDDQLGSDGPVLDLNGDGQPEVMVSDTSIECYGDTGQHFSIVSPVPGGWKLIFDSGEGLPLIQNTTSKTGWRDVVAGGPGFCHELYRFNGRAYASFKSFEETKGACSH